MQWNGIIEFPSIFNKSNEYTQESFSIPMWSIQVEGNGLWECPLPSHLISQQSLTLSEIENHLFKIVGNNSKDLVVLHFHFDTSISSSFSSSNSSSFSSYNNKQIELQSNNLDQALQYLKEQQRYLLFDYQNQQDLNKKCILYLIPPGLKGFESVKSTGSNVLWGILWTSARFNEKLYYPLSNYSNLSTSSHSSSFSSPKFIFLNSNNNNNIESEKIKSESKTKLKIPSRFSLVSLLSNKTDQNKNNQKEKK